MLNEQKQALKKDHIIGSERPFLAVL